MKIKKIFVPLVILILLPAFLWLSSCKHVSIIPDTVPEICFETEVLPVFQNSCGMTGCHDGNGEGGFSLNNYLGISHSVTAGRPYESRVYKAIIAKTGENMMPPDKPLSAENRTIIRLWIQQGAKLTSCPATPPLDTTTSPPTSYVNPRACFSRDVLPVLVSSCAMTGCHDAATHKEGFIFASYSTTLNAVKPGNPTGSKLYTVITTLTGEKRMPPSPMNRLSNAAIDSIKAWIKYGALNEVCGETCDTINPVKFSGTIWPVIQTSCLGCHSGTAPGGGIKLETYANVSAIASSGMLMNALKGNGIPKMPPAGTLSTCKLRQFELWTKNGYLNN